MNGGIYPTDHSVWKPIRFIRFIRENSPETLFSWKIIFPIEKFIFLNNSSVSQISNSAISIYVYARVTESEYFGWISRDHRSIKYLFWPIAVDNRQTTLSVLCSCCGRSDPTIFTFAFYSASMAMLVSRCFLSKINVSPVDSFIRDQINYYSESK